MLNQKFILGLSALLIAGVANATGNHFFYTNRAADAALNTDPNVNQSWFGQAAGSINAISTYFNGATNEFSWYSNHSKNATGDTANAFWLVVSTGANPKGTPGQLAAMYFDATQPGTPKLSVYGYNGVNGSNSWSDGSSAAGTQTPDRIISSITSSFVNSFTNVTEANGTKTLGFNIKTDVINGYNPTNGSATGWEGIDFSSSIGVWFHPVTKGSTSYDAKGFLTSFNYGAGGFVDLENARTRGGNPPVPEPATLAAIGIGAIGMLRRRRSSK